jgi:hypothetical protein
MNVTSIYEEAGQELQLCAMPSIMMIGLNLINPTLCEVAKMLYEFGRPCAVKHLNFIRGDQKTVGPGLD